MILCLSSFVFVVMNIKRDVDIGNNVYVAYFRNFYFLNGVKNYLKKQLHEKGNNLLTIPSETVSCN